MRHPAALRIALDALVSGVRRLCRLPPVRRRYGLHPHGPARAGESRVLPAWGPASDYLAGAGVVAPAGPVRHHTAVAVGGAYPHCAVVPSCVARRVVPAARDASECSCARACRPGRHRGVIIIIITREIRDSLKSGIARKSKISRKSWISKKSWISGKSRISRKSRIQVFCFAPDMLSTHVHTQRPPQPCPTRAPKAKTIYTTKTVRKIRGSGKRPIPGSRIGKWGWGPGGPPIPGSRIEKQLGPTTTLYSSGIR